MTLTVLDPRTGHKVTITVADKPPAARTPVATAARPRRLAR